MKPVTLFNQRGLSIIELMVALVLSLILLTGVIQVFLSTKQTYATNDAMSHLQENGRFALEFIARNARLGGYTNPTELISPPLPVQGKNCGDACSLNGSGADSDTLAIAFQPPRDEGTGLHYDCAGASVDDDKVLVNVFKTLNGSLVCSSYYIGTTTAISSNKPLVEGIDRLQVLYGVNTAGKADSVDQYISADRVTSLNKWDQVRAIRLAVLANSVTPVNPTPPARKFALLDATPVSFSNAEARLGRQIFTTTILLKNTN
ncbi:PilW family protein [Pseudomonas sp. PDM13]|uniref:PilW family protein n=1 Tax=Pseudomonas sp. PDM13 TaxID=2769255 RepID=UPI0021DFB9CC|nr:PilW family protein [Pseudomonas sp. PDM13]MCU9946814.1 PilW family protein [Pseudomonas sp. PDM13]